MIISLLFTVYRHSQQLTSRGRHWNGWSMEMCTSLSGTVMALWPLSLEECGSGKRRSRSTSQSVAGTMCPVTLPSKTVEIGQNRIPTLSRLTETAEMTTTLATQGKEILSIVQSMERPHSHLSRSTMLSRCVPEVGYTLLFHLEPTAAAPMATPRPPHSLHTS